MSNTAYQRAVISIHALREEGDKLEAENPEKAWNFYPRPPRGGRPYNGSIFTKSFEISIHALREEGDSARKSHCVPNRKFLSTPSARRATCFKKPFIQNNF